jgi:solute carrier family 15 oligopeptide transporter 1
VSGLILIAIGTGGIKPCVSNFGGDQYPRKAIRSRAFFFAAFYFTVNAGSLASTFITPILSHHVHCFGSDSCYPLAFGVPALLMIIALSMYVIGSPLYSALSMSRPGRPLGGTKYDELFEDGKDRLNFSGESPKSSKSMSKSIFSENSLTSSSDTLHKVDLNPKMQKGTMISDSGNFTDKESESESEIEIDLEKEEAETKILEKNDLVLRFLAYSAKKICRQDISMYQDNQKFCQDCDCMLKLVVLFLPIMFFWALFDQQGSRWIFQAMLMDPRVKIPFTRDTYLQILPEQTALVNSVLVLLFIPIFTYCVYPLIERIGGFRLRPTTKMCVGMFLGAAAFGVATLLQFIITSYGTFAIDEKGSEHCVSGCVCVAWQLPQYILITAAEVFVSITGLSFAYEVSPETMRTVCQAVWQLSIALGNLVVVFVTLVNPVAWFIPKTSMESVRLPWNFALWTGIILVASVVFVPMSRKSY